MRLSFRSAALLTAIVATPAIASAQYGTNIIVNPGAEAGAGNSGGNTVPSVPGWSQGGTAATVVPYDAGSGFPASSDPGPAARGTNFFAGGPSNGSSALTQSVSLSFASSAIATGTESFTLSGWFGGYGSQNDNAVLTLQFLNASNVNIGSLFSVGGVTAADRANATGMLFRTFTGLAPIGASSANLTLQLTRTDGDYNDGYADNLSLIFAQPNAVTTTPEPAAIAMLGTGLVGLVPLARRKRA